jgi:ABC-type uncharacterized transport system involved in gliding motility auxiliary subunit
MKNKPFQTFLYSSIGIVAMAAILIAINVIGSAMKQRVDLTQEKAYTLSAGTRAILKKLDTPIKIHFYCSQPKDASPEAVMLKGYARQVEDLLAEYKQAAHGKLIIQRFDPEPDSDAEDLARLDGVEGAMMRDGEKFYLGLAAVQLDQKQALPFLDPSRERLLEYDLSRAISRVGTPEKPVVGVMSPLRVFGMPSNPMMMRMGQQGGQEPWLLISELKNDFTVKNLGMDVDKIDDDVKVMLVIHPRDITEKAQFALDQFVLRGGKMIAFLDPLPLVIDTKEQNQMFGAVPNNGSSLDKLFSAWGIKFESGKVVADLNFKVQLGGRGGQPQEAPAFLSITKEGINGEDVLTSQIDNVWLPFAGAFSGTPAEGLKETVLLKSTKDSQIVDGFMANLAGETILKDFKASGTSYPLAIRLTGKFKTAFPNGKPEDKKDAEPKTDDKKEGDKKPEEKVADKKPDDSLKTATQDSTVILVGDADMLHDRVALQQNQGFFGPVYQPANGNFAFAQNAIELLAGDNALINVRSRATLNRPFTRINALETVANEKFQSEIKRLEESAAEAQRKVNELQQAKKDKDQRFILSQEQQAELVKLRAQETDTRKHLNTVRKDLKKEVVSLENHLKIYNIAAMPLLVCLSGLALAFYKRKRTGAK